MMREQNQNEETQTPNENQEPPEQEQEQLEQTQEAEQPPEEVEAKPADEATEEPAEGEEPAQTEQAKAEEKRRRAGGWQRKIERLERERQLLMEQNARLAAQHQPPAANQDKPKDAATQMQEYIRAEARAVLEAEREQQRQAQVLAELGKREAEFRAKHEDYDEAVYVFRQSGVPPTHIEALLTSPEGPAIVYGLYRNRDELARFCALSPLDAAREIGRLEARASVTPTPKPATKTATRPPAPPTNVPGNSSSTRSLDELPISEYKRAYRSGRR